MPIDFLPHQEFIAYGYTREESVPYPAYPSGAREKDESVYAYPTRENNNPLLIIEEDIVDKDGYGLKRGFYETCLDENKDFLLLFQSGKLKAKLPILEIEQRKDIPPTSNTPKKAKKKKKNYKGIDSEDFVYNNAEIRHWREKECYMVIWERSNTRVKAFIKVR